ncbi:DUF397 domain-containing protein [Spirillospora sp. CA-253888]
MTETRLSSVRWRKSSYSTQDGTDCVEVAAESLGKAVMARDSKDPAGPMLSLSQDAWASFLVQTKQGVHDLA